MKLPSRCLSLAILSGWQRDLELILKEENRFFPSSPHLMDLEGDEVAGAPEELH